jgi:hypothetical protein
MWDTIIFLRKVIHTYRFAFVKSNNYEASKNSSPLYRWLFSFVSKNWPSYLQNPVNTDEAIEVVETYRASWYLNPIHHKIKPKCTKIFIFSECQGFKLQFICDLEQIEGSLAVLRTHPVCSQTQHNTRFLLLTTTRPCQRKKNWRRTRKWKWESWYSTICHRRS